MMTERNIQKMEALMNNEDFAEKVVAADSQDEVYRLFVANGVDASYEDYTAYLQESRNLLVHKGVITEDGELSAEALDTVSGGSYRGKALLTFAGLACLYYGALGPGAILILLALLH